MGWKKRLLVFLIAWWLLWKIVTVVKMSWWLWVVLGIPIAAIAGLLFAYFFLAKPSQNRWFTFVKEGTAKIVVRGDAFEKVIIRFEGRDLCREAKQDSEGKIIQDKWDIIEVPDRKKRRFERIFGGFVYYGFHPFVDVYVYDFAWTGVTENGEIIHHPKESLDYILLKEDVYWAKIEKAEDQDLLPLDVEVIMTIRIVNPRKAIFEVQKWLEAVINRIKPWARDVVTQDTYDNLIKKKEEIGNKILENLRNTKILEEEFINRYGVDVRKIEVKDINPPEEYRETTLKKFIAEREREAVVIGADAESQRLDTVYRKIQEFGDLGKLIRALEAIEKSPLAASLTVQAIPGLPEVLKGIFGKSVETISPEEFKGLKEQIEKLQKEKK